MHAGVAVWVEGLARSVVEGDVGAHDGGPLWDAHVEEKRVLGVDCVAEGVGEGVGCFAAYGDVVTVAVAVAVERCRDPRRAE